MIKGQEEAEAMIPPMMLTTLKNYVDNRLTPGSCTRAILENDLFGAYRRADPDTRNAMEAIVFWIFNYAPGDCWGSKEAVAAWLKR